MDKNIEYGGVKIYYEDEGKGLSLVLVHGFCEDKSVWAEFKATLTKATNSNIRIITPDLPGFGKSGAVNNLSIEILAEIIKEILDKEKIQQCIMIGHSMGGYITLAFAEKYPSMLQGFGLFHSSAFADDENKKADRTKAIEFIEKNGTKGFVNELIPKLFAPDFARQNPGIVNQLKEKAYPYPARALTEALRAMRERPDRTAALKNASCPVLFIIGKLDAAIPFEKVMLQCHLPKTSSVHILENAGHMGMMEAREETTNILKEFLNEVSNSQLL